MATNQDIEIAIDEMRENLKTQYAGMDMLKATARSVLASASLIVGLLGTLQLIRPLSQSANLNLFTFGLLAAMALYILLIVFCAWSLLAVEMHAPIAAKWNVLHEGLFGKEDRELLKVQLSCILNAIAKNLTILDRQRRLVTVSTLLLPAIVVILMLLSLAPR